jgi:hypothetical protein
VPHRRAINESDDEAKIKIRALAVTQFALDTKAKQSSLPQQVPKELNFILLLLYRYLFIHQNQSVIMAKKAKGDNTSKKSEQKKKQKILEDKTFGLKNKNKSKKVQQYIESTTKSVMNTGDRKQRQLEEQRKKQKAEAKLRKKAMKDEQNALFGEALLAIGKKGKQTNMKDGKLEAKGRDHDDDNKKGTSRAMKMMYQMDAKEMEDRLKEDVSSRLSTTVLVNVKTDHGFNSIYLDFII